MRRVYFLPLGCYRNQVDSEKYAAWLKNKGFKIVSSLKQADILIINTCAFIAAAREESVEAIKEALLLKRKKKIRKLIVAGCLVKLYWRELLEYTSLIDALWGLDIVNNHPSRFFLKTSHVAYLKISEGCSFRCSYCRIPQIKGTLRSRTLKSILREVEWLDGHGVRELVIIGQDTTSWGKDIYRQKDFAFLLRQIVKNISQIKWIRIMYAHPLSLSEPIIKTIAAIDKICNYIDLPLQHINDRILRLMNRRTSRHYLERLLRFIRKNIPDVSLRTTFIVGFPTETDVEFEELVSFVKDTEFKNLSAFIYSPEAGTPAYNLPAVESRKKRERFHYLMRVQRDVSRRLNEKLVGKELEFIIDDSNAESSWGRSYYDAYEIDGAAYIDRGFSVGKIVKGKVVGASAYDIMVKTRRRN